jgi:hypothetical protein
MNWEALGAIGELLGSVGVLFTIVYFGVQLKRMQTSTRVSIMASIAQSRVALSNQRLDHMELLCKANAGDQVTDVEVEKLRSIYVSEASQMMFAFMNFRDLGGDGKIQARNFARYIRDNPGLARFWSEEDEGGQRYNEVPNPQNVRWRASVNQQLESIGAASLIE